MTETKNPPVAPSSGASGSPRRRLESGLSHLLHPLVRAVFAFSVLVALAVYAAQIALDPARANHDVGWTLYAGAQLLDGARFSVDIIDNNPPLIYWGSGVITWLSRLFGVSAFLTYNWLVLLLICGTSLVCWQRLGRATQRKELAEGIALGTACILAVAPGYNFGQREHIIIALLLPYMLAAALGSSGLPGLRWQRIAIGLAAGIAIAIKPHFSLVWLAVESVAAVRQRRLRYWNRTENWTILLVGLVYVGAVCFFTPAYLSTVRDTLVVWHAYDAPVDIFQWKTIPVFLAVGLAVAVRPKSTIGSYAAILAAAAAASLLIVIIQNKDYPYHYVPAMVSACISLISLVAALVEHYEERARLPSSTWAKLYVVAAQVCIVFAIVGAFRFEWEGTYSGRRKMARLIDDYGRGEPVLFFSSSVDPLFPTILFTRSTSSSPYSCLWMIAGNYTSEQRTGRSFPYRTIDQMPSVERRFATTIVDSMEVQRPRILFFDRAGWKQGFGVTRFEFERYFQADVRFQRLMREYRRLGSFRPFVIYIRRDPTPTR